MLALLPLLASSALLSHTRAPAMPALSSPRCSRRQVLPLVAAWAAASRFAPSAHAADSTAKVWTSGRSDPIRPTSKDKPDGTKKDPKYLGCLNDCVPACSSTYGQSGPAKERSDCLDQCQDQCCSTYQQCTYTIRR